MLEPPDVAVVPLTLAHAALVAAWRYEGPWAVYDVTDESAISAELGYHAIVEVGSGALVGFVCEGPEARVPGLLEEPGVVDVGVGLDPAVLGRGRGGSIVGPVLDWLQERATGTRLRAVVQAWNIRSRRLCRGLEFSEVGRHFVDEDSGQVEYVVLERPI